MASYNPPLFNSSIFNADAFVSDNTPLTLEEANNRYLTKSFPTGFGNLNMSGSIEAYNQLKIENDINTNITSSTNASEYGIHLHHNGASNGIKLANGIAFLNSNTDMSPGASITFNRTGTNSTGDLIFSTKSATTCTEKMRILANGNMGIGLNNPTYTLDINGSFKTLSSAITIQGNQDGGTGRGIYWWASGDANWGSYFAQSGSGKSLSAGTAVAGAGFSSYAIRNRILANNTSGFIWENSNEQLIASIRADGLTYFAGNVGIGTTSPSYPLHINSTVSTSVSGYGYLNGSGNTGFVSGSSGSANFSAYLSGRLVCNGEINVISDYRKKKNIINLDDEFCKSFIKKTNPVSFKYKNDDLKTNYGYIAQDILKQGFDNLVSIAPENGLEEIIEEDGFINPKDNSFNISTNQIIPILHKNIQILYKEIEELKNNKK